jgi:hypothetical protein
MTRLVVFSRVPGQVAVFPDFAAPARFSFRMGADASSRWNGFYSMKAFITRFMANASGNLQVLHGWESRTFISVFGDRVNGISVAGLAFESICNDNGMDIGIERVIAYYNQNRVANRQLPIQLAIGASSVITAYMVGLETRLEDPAQRIWQFTMQLVGIPLADRRPRPAGSKFESKEGEGKDKRGGGGKGSPTPTPPPYPPPYPGSRLPHIVPGDGVTRYVFPAVTPKDPGGGLKGSDSAGVTPTGWDAYGTGARLDLARGFTHT